jgi:hypothetical protein
MFKEFNRICLMKLHFVRLDQEICGEKWFNFKLQQDFQKLWEIVQSAKLLKDIMLIPLDLLQEVMALQVHQEVVAHVNAVHLVHLVPQDVTVDLVLPDALVIQVHLVVKAFCFLVLHQNLHVKLE